MAFFYLQTEANLRNVPSTSSTCISKTGTEKQLCQQIMNSLQLTDKQTAEEEAEDASSTAAAHDDSDESVRPK